MEAGFGLIAISSRFGSGSCLLGDLWSSREERKMGEEADSD
jgi:hypothetical protein